MTLLTAASFEAMACARAYRARVLPSDHPLPTAERLRRRAARAARSPLALDQLFAICLQALAVDPRTSAQRACGSLAASNPIDGLMVRHAVLASKVAPLNRAEIAAIVAAEELRGGRKLGRNPRKLAEHLRQASQLARRLWDHPALPASPKVRGAMLSAAPALEARAKLLLDRPPPHAGLSRAQAGDAFVLAAV